MNEFEIKIVRYFNQIGSEKFDSFLALVNSIRFLFIFWMAIVSLAVIRHIEIAERFIGAVVFVAVLHFVFTEGVIKHLFFRIIPPRKRPYVKYASLIRPIGRKFSDSSFPSSHMTTSVAMFFVITSFYPSLIIPAVIMVVAMASSRLHNGMHYPSDVLAGALLGWGYGWIALEIMRIINPQVLSFFNSL